MVDMKALWLKLLTFGVIVLLLIYGGFYGSLAFACVTLLATLRFIDGDDAPSLVICVPKHKEYLSEDIAQGVMDVKGFTRSTVLILDLEAIEAEFTKKDGGA